jgi:hypothetical protein
MIRLSARRCHVSGIESQTLVRMWHGLIFSLLLAGACVLGCGGASPASPFVQRDGGSGTDAGVDAIFDAGVIRDSAPPPDADPTLGGPCLDDGQCDDGVSCTADRCDPALARCRNVPDDASCADDVYCDGAEVCDPKLGCREGEPVSCSDDFVCTIDGCVEATRSCTHTPRDADGDGDAVWNCTGGTDCNDTDPLISGQAKEICKNSKDDDCDGTVDEADGCVTSKFDTCVEPLDVTASGRYFVSTAGARPDYAASCAGSGGSWREVVVALTVPSGPALDVDITATASSTSLALAAARQCGDASSELGCENAEAAAAGGGIARLLLRALPAGSYPIYVFATSDLEIAIDVEFSPVSPKPTNETCATAAPLSPGVHVTLPLIDAAHDLESQCSRRMGDLVYTFELTQPSDVHLRAVSIDGRGIPLVSLRGSSCSLAKDELMCQTAQAPHVFARSLGPGRYFVAVSATAPTEVDLVLDLAPPSVPPADENCVSSPVLPKNKTIDVSLLNHTDDIQLGCVTGATDAAYRLDVASRSDILLVQRITRGDFGSVSLSRAACASGDDVVGCAVSSESPVRTSLHGVAPGDYRVVSESTLGGATQLTAFVRDAISPVFVAFADDCSSAYRIPEGGGRFVGNTANASADQSAGCDLAGQSPAGAPDQLLSLNLSAPRRVILDMQGSEYATVLGVRRGPSCPGEEIDLGCAAGYAKERSFLDLRLGAGQYFVQIDGYSGASGAWSLDVHVVDP